MDKVVSTAQAEEGAARGQSLELKRSRHRGNLTEGFSPMASMTTESTFRAIAIAIIVLCLPIGLFVVPPLLFWTFHSLGKNLTDTVVTRREHTLVTHGPYRWVRHPFYIVVFLWGLSMSLLTANWLLALLGGAAVMMLVARTRVEEDKLAERFGDEYHAYARRTGRFLPLVRRRL